MKKKHLIQWLAITLSVAFFTGPTWVSVLNIETQNEKLIESQDSTRNDARIIRNFMRTYVNKTLKREE